MKPRSRIVYLVLVLFLVVIALPARLTDWYPLVIVIYVADAVWAMMVYLLLALIFARIPPRQVLLLCLVGCWLVEFSQLYQAEWINEVRQWPLMGLLLGYGFRWEDLLAYTIGAFAGFLLDLRLTKAGQENFDVPAKSV